MAKVKNPSPQSKQSESLIYAKCKSEKDGFTHNVRAKRLKSKRKKTK